LTNRRIEITARHRDGREFPIELTIAPVRQGDARLFSAFLRDISARKGTEDQLRFQSTILSNVRDSIVVTDLSGRVQFWNTGAEAVFGYSAEEIVGRSVGVLDVDGDSHRLPADLQRIQTGEDLIGERQRRRKDGTTVWIDSKRVVLRDARGEAIGILGVARDITEGKRATEALQATHERLRDFAGRMRSVREQERALMARQIHDEVGLVLTALGMDVAWLEARLSSSAPPLVEMCRAMAALIDGTIGRCARWRPSCGRPCWTISACSRRSNGRRSSSCGGPASPARSICPPRFRRSTPTARRTCSAFSRRR
jgi:PAS domain S-box-containing protein